MKHIVFALLILFAASSCAKTQYNIKITIKGMADSSIIVGHYYGADIFIDDTLRLNKKATATFSGNEKLDEGLYIIQMPNQKKIDFIIGSDQTFEIENDITDLVENMKVSGSAECNDFVLLTKYMEQQTMLIETKAKQRNNVSKEEAAKINGELKTLTTAVSKYRKDLLDKYKNSFLGLFILSTNDVNMPDSITRMDRQSQYMYYRNHYFDNFDFNDKRILNSSVFVQRLMLYLNRVIPQRADTVNIEIDKIISHCKKNENTFRYVLGHLHNYFLNSNVMGFENVFIHLSDKYYLTGEASWVSDEFREQLGKHVERIRHVMIGAAAKELKMMTMPKETASIMRLKNKIKELKTAGERVLKDTTKTQDEQQNQFVDLMDRFLENTEEYTSLHQIEAEVTLVWFWESACSHCQERTPKLKQLYDKYHQKGLSIYCVNVESAYFMYPEKFFEDSEKNWDTYTRHLEMWADFIIEHNLQQLTHVWDPYEATEFRKYYNIENTPTLYLLDDQKRFVAKKLSLQQIEEILGNIFSSGE